MASPTEQDKAQGIWPDAPEEVLRRYEHQRPEVDYARRTAGRDHFWKNSTELMAVIGLDGRPASVNPAWVRTLGYDEGTLLRTPFLEIIHPDDREQVGAAIRRLQRGESVSGLEIRLGHADGSTRLVSWRWALGAGEYFAIGHDVTGERLTEEQLRQAQKMEAMGQLTGGIAHDFNNLLAGIVGSLDLLGKRLRQGRTSDLDRYVFAAMTSAQRAAALTHRLLAFSRRRPLELRPVNASEVVTGLEDLLRRTLGPAISLEIRLADDLWRTVCDQVQLESAILNLCINARDAMPNGGRLTVETGNVSADDGSTTIPPDVPPGQYVTIRVSDTGAGMSPEVLAHVLDPFFTTKPVGQGTGLGVPMVFNFAREAGGFVRFSSQEGQGTAVELYLRSHHGAVGRHEDTGQQPEPSLQTKAGKTVLIVEDEPVVRGLLVEVLEDQGYRILEASDGLAGLKVLQSDLPIDLLISDIGLPGLNGRQLIEQARKTRPDLRALLITGYADMVETNGSEPELVVLAKPFDVDMLLRNVRRLIAGMGRWA